MHNVWLIARREYLERIRTRGFVITTVLIPLLMGGAIFGSSLLGSRSQHIAAVSSDTDLALDLQTEFQEDKASHVVIYPMSSGVGPAAQQAFRRYLNQGLESGEMDGYLWISPAGSSGGGPVFAYTPSSTADASSVTAKLSKALTAVLAHEATNHRGVVATEPGVARRPIAIQVQKPTERKDTQSATASVTILFFLMYMVIMLYGMNVARSIIEEKTSRIFEVMLATIRPAEMMAGKILGVGSVGLTQVAIWLTAALLLARTRVAANLGGTSVHFTLSTAQIAFFFVYFILGYAFYSSIAAGLGAMTNSEQELQQLNMFLVLPLAVCFITLGRVITVPDGNLARTLALIPPFTPLIMYLRISVGHPHGWEIALSIVLTCLSIGAIVWVTSRIYRIGVLMYGKRPNLAEILRWLKYS